MSYSEPISVERRAAHHYRLHWQAEFSGLVDSIEVSAALAAQPLPAHIAIETDGADIRNLPDAARHFFHLTLKNGSRLTVAERRLALRESPNFRDFGGYASADGRRVRWGQLFRSGQLDRVVDLDQQQIAALNIRLVCDFRRDTEREYAPNRFAPGHAPRIENLAIAPGSSANLFEGDGSPIDNGAQMMIAINRDLALEQTPAYTRMFKALVDADGPILIHCAVGKDRTGFAAALIHAALGVPETAILHDYLLTDRYLPIEAEIAKLQEKYQLSGPTDGLVPILQVRREYIYGALDAIVENFGSIDAYLREALAVDNAMLAELRGRWLE